MGPRDVHSRLSSSLRLSCSSTTAALVRAGLATEAPMAGPPVVFTICGHAHTNKSTRHLLPSGCEAQIERTLSMSPLNLWIEDMRKHQLEHNQVAYVRLLKAIGSIPANIHSVIPL